jgi:hypothetical protein
VVYPAGSCAALHCQAGSYLTQADAIYPWLETLMPGVKSNSTNGGGGNVNFNGGGAVPSPYLLPPPMQCLASHTL